MVNRLPVSLTSFVGRQDEIARLMALLRQPECRLLTLVGPGGTGKTRLALETARQRAAQLRDGAVFVALQPVNTPDFVIHAIGAAIGMQVLEGETLLDALVQVLQQRQMLLVLDNAEHVLEAVPLLVDLLERVPGLQMLVTSREVLNVAGEQVYEVSGLEAASDAVQLFISRATGARHDFDAAREQAHIIAICRLVGGLPLAIELAAAWTRTLACAEIAAEIQRSADFLATGQRNLPERHRSIRAVFEQSWERLDAARQQVFSRLAVFSGFFTREAAEAVTGAALHDLSALVDQSLIQAAPDRGYTIHSLLREYAEERLRSTDTDYQQLYARHAEYYLDQVRGLDAHIKSARQVEALHRLDALLDNIRQAWRYAVEHHRADLIQPAFETLSMYYQMRCRLAEGYDMFALAADEFAPDNTLLAGLLLLGKSWFTSFSGRSSDEQARVTTFQGMAILRSQTMPGLGAMLLRGGKTAYADLAEVKRLLAENEAAYRARDDHWGLAWTLNNIPRLEDRGKPESKIRLQAALDAALRCGDRWSATWTQAVLGLIAEREGRYDDALRLYVDRLATCEQVGDTGGVAWSLQQLAKVSLEQNDIQQSIYYCRESLRVALEISSGNSVNEAIWRISFIYSQRGQNRPAVELLSTLYHVQGDYIGHILFAQVERELQRLREALPAAEYDEVVQAGQRWTPRRLGERLLEELAALLKPVRPDEALASDLIEPLSEREIEVLRLVAAGLSNSEVAERLVVTSGTVKKHLNNIFGKLGVQRRTQALLRAQALGLIAE